MINGNVSSEFISFKSLWSASVHGAASSIQNWVSPLLFVNPVDYTEKIVAELEGWARKPVKASTN